MSKKINLGPVTAYAIAVANGFVGSVQEWLASLKGEKGDRGEKGEKGDTGPQGPQGPEGPRGEQVQPDLTVNDPNDPRYVNGRTHWVEEELVAISEEQTVSGFAVMQDPIYAVRNPFEFVLSEGQTYTVTWDGTAYECVCGIAGNLLYIGNVNYVNMESGGDIPFAIIYNPSNGFLFLTTESTEESHTIGINSKVTVIHPIDPKYLTSMHTTFYLRSLDPDGDFIPFYNASCLGARVSFEDAKNASNGIVRFAGWENTKFRFYYPFLVKEENVGVYFYCLNENAEPFRIYCGEEE